MTRNQLEILSEKLSRNQGSISVLGVDASLRGTGWSFMKDRNILSHGVLKTKSFGSKGFASLEWDTIKMKESVDKIHKIIELAKPDVIAIEIPHITQRASVAIQIGIVWGCLSSIVSDEKTIVIDQTYLKNWSMSRKGDKKNKVEEKVRRRVIVDSNDDNIIDAIGICLMIQDHYDYINYKRQGSTETR